MALRICVNTYKYKYKYIYIYIYMRKHTDGPTDRGTGPTMASHDSSMVYPASYASKESCLARAHHHLPHVCTDTKGDATGGVAHRLVVRARRAFEVQVMRPEQARDTGLHRSRVHDATRTRDALDLSWDWAHDGES